MAYLNEIAVFSPTWEEHLHHLGYVLQALEQAQLTRKAGKCQNGESKVIYLRHAVGGGDIRLLPSKVQTVKDLATPSIQTTVRTFLGLTGYYSNFIENNGTVTSPLNVITSPKLPKKVMWNEECTKAFEGLKKALCQAPVLRSPEYNQSFIVQTDDSNTCIGAVLSQLDEKCREHPI
ncbi:uncharacterized protein [Ambystoma mexicanum]|uniref:uncharacterized protein n=1 Tax=Ambystoma mexicanum TaxID=8296 RepID=UPI0037E812FF